MHELALRRTSILIKLTLAAALVALFATMTSGRVYANRSSGLNGGTGGVCVTVVGTDAEGNTIHYVYCR